MSNHYLLYSTATKGTLSYFFRLKRSEEARKGHLSSDKHFLIFFCSSGKEDDVGIKGSHKNDIRRGFPCFFLTSTLGWK